MNAHTSKYKCTECGKCFASKQMLTQHRRIHSGEKPFECTVCNKRFITSRSLVVHSRIHSGEKPYKCHECDKAFRQPSQLNTHMKGHTGERTYKCSLCNKSFIYLSGLHKHKHRIHSNSRPYQCPYCGKLFVENSELKQHIRIHTFAKPYPCSQCSDHFRWRHQLKTHLLRSHNEGTWLACHICQKKFTDSGPLKVHILRHEGVKPYVCSECPKSFCTAGELRSHSLSHSDVKHFCCGACGKYFRYKHNVIIHFNKYCEKSWQWQTHSRFLFRFGTFFPERTSGNYSDGTFMRARCSSCSSNTGVRELKDEYNHGWFFIWGRSRTCPPDSRKVIVFIVIDLHILSTKLFGTGSHVPPRFQESYSFHRYWFAYT